MHTTSLSLLDRLRKPTDDADVPFDNLAWARFVSLYTPLLLSWARKVCRQEDEVVDLLQEVFATLLVKLPQFNYDSQKSFRGWLRTVAVNKWRERLRRRALKMHVGDMDQIAEAVSDSDDDAFWETDYRRQLVDRAMEVMRADFAPRTWKACWDMVVNGKSAPEVAKEFDMTVGSVYAAKIRVLARLREELEPLVR
jgi:RNA polymerase sigma-70 factor (ECF subfamily)